MMRSQDSRPLARLGASMAVAIAVVLCTAHSARVLEGPDDGQVVRVTEELRRVDLNSASAQEMALLPGIGRAIAGRIVSDRAERGPFASVDELRRVKGIGAATVERVRPFATAGRAT